MEIHKGIQQVPKINNPILTIGTFDGVHLGHQKILHRLSEEAKKSGGSSVLFTFYPHPRMVLFPENTDLKLIQTQEEKIKKLESAGLDHLIVEPFTKNFSRLTATQFIRDYLVNSIGVKKIIIGYDHQFGKNREGNLEHLKELSSIYGFEVEEIPAKDIDEVNISSTKIRKALASGNMEKANTFLGAPFILSGKVIHGDGRGRNLGFPTANLDTEDRYKLIPANGVYAVQAIVNNQPLNGMMNIGVRPTYDGVEKRLEVHLFDFEGDLYDRKLEVKILKRLRDEKKFDDVNTLVKQLKQDEKICMDYFAVH